MSQVAERVQASEPVRLVRAALGDSAGSAWVVGGAVRDALLGRPITDVDVVVDGDPGAVARAVARAAGGPVFPLSEEFGAWRAILRPGLVCDVSPLQGGSIEADLAKRDFTANAMAVPLGGAELLDPHGGSADIDAGILRVLGEQSYRDDPLRPLRLARIATELELRPDEETERLTRAHASRVPETSPERIWAELRRLVTAERVLDGLELAGRLGLTDAVLPELGALRGVEQSHFHHLDVYDHTVQVLREQLALERDLGAVFGELAPEVAAVLDEPLADELTRLQALRFAALFHDLAKPPTRRELPDGRISFIGHDRVGEEMVTALCRRLRTSARLASFLGHVTRHHLVLGFLVHERPLDRRAVYRYLRTCEPVEVEVTVLSCADRRATRGKNAEAAIAAHLELAFELMGAALDWRREGAPRPPLRGDALARAVGIEPGPELGRLVEALCEAVFAGEVQDRDQAVAYARALRQDAQP